MLDEANTVEYPGRRWDDVIMLASGDEGYFFGGALDEDRLAWRHLEDPLSEHLVRKAWIIAMLNDDNRCNAYDAAIRQVARGIVLDIGAGTGLLSMMAARCGGAVTKVVAVEMELVMVDLLRKHVDKSVEVFHGHSTQIELVEKADVVVSELLDHFLLGEGWITAMRDAAARLAKPGAVFVPSGATVYCALAVRRRRVAIDDNCPGATRTRRVVRVDAGGDDVALLTEATVACRIDMPPPDTLPGPTLVSLIPNRGSLGAVADCVIYWWTAHLAEGIDISNAPPTRQDHWAQALQPIEPITLSESDVQLEVEVSDDGIRFGKAAEPGGECECGWHNWLSPFRRENVCSDLPQSLREESFGCILDLSAGNGRIVAAENAKKLICVCEDVRNACVVAKKKREEATENFSIATSVPRSSEDLVALFDEPPPLCDLAFSDCYYADLEGNPVMTFLRVWRQFKLARAILAHNCRYDPRYATFFCRPITSDRIRRAYAPLPESISGCGHAAVSKVWYEARRDKMISLDLGLYKDDLRTSGPDTQVAHFDLVEDDPPSKGEELEFAVDQPPEKADLLAFYVKYSSERDFAEEGNDEGRCPHGIENKRQKLSSCAKADDVGYALVHFCSLKDSSSGQQKTVLRAILRSNGDFTIKEVK